MYRGQWLWSQNSWCFFLLLLRAELSKDIDTLEEGEKLHKVFSEKWLIVIPIEIKKNRLSIYYRRKGRNFKQNIVLYSEFNPAVRPSRAIEREL